ncbi:TetR/AcrR family transcriptional regulator [Amphritea pacifica]|uniref:TetR/AcrR family transcriptional regulator n=1 Tax=Amphritea pacifica TaxID=2811233 RepID=UPI001963EDAE|nr:TetR/AcrR family transcriptional regulator [Amphritea pacifica]MBN1006101.1 TetR/AcrR family transcriptional regulator [Amphritea pacifica]
MPYSSEHKQNSREKILQSAYRLFSTKGFDNVTIDRVMQDCSLTRGAFYGHFRSKSELYKEALKFAASTSKLADIKPEGLSSREWLSVLLDGYLSLEHVNGERPCPLAFLATDIVSRDKETHKTYARGYTRMNQLILDYAGRDTVKNAQDIFSLTSMIIGAVAVSRTLGDQQQVQQILSSCRQQARLMLGGI